MIKSIYKIVSLILIILLFQSCTSIKYIYSKDNPYRIPSKLKRTDLNKRINIYQHDTLYVRGRLLEYTPTELKISKEETQDTMTMQFAKINKVALEQKEVPLPLFLLFIGICYGIYSIGNLADDIPTD